MNKPPVSVRNIIEEIENKFMEQNERSKKLFCPLTKSRISLKGQTENTKGLWKITFLVVKNINRSTKNNCREFSKNIKQTYIEIRKRIQIWKIQYQTNRSLTKMKTKKLEGQIISKR